MLPWVADHSRAVCGRASPLLPSGARVPLRPSRNLHRRLQHSPRRPHLRPTVGRRVPCAPARAASACRPGCRSPRWHQRRRNNEDRANTASTSSGHRRTMAPPQLPEPRASQTGVQAEPPGAEGCRIGRGVKSKYRLGRPNPYSIRARCSARRSEVGRMHGSELGFLRGIRG